MRKVVFTWEMGEGLGYLVPFVSLAASLQARGHKVVFTVSKGTPLFLCVVALNQFKVVGGSNGFASVSRTRYGRRADSQQL